MKTVRGMLLQIVSLRFEEKMNEGNKNSLSLSLSCLIPKGLQTCEFIAILIPLCTRSVTVSSFSRLTLTKQQLHTLKLIICNSYEMRLFVIPRNYFHFKGTEIHFTSCMQFYGKIMLIFYDQFLVAVAMVKFCILVPMAFV